MGCFFSGCFVCWGPKVPWLLLQQSCVGREASSRQEGRPSSLTLTPVCLSCLLTPDMGWDNPGSGAKLVTSTYQIRAESCINPLLNRSLFCASCIWVFVLFSSFPCPWPKCFVAKTLFCYWWRRQRGSLTLLRPHGPEQQDTVNFTRTAHMLKLTYVW